MYIHVLSQVEKEVGRGVPSLVYLPLMVIQKQIPGFELIWPGYFNPLAHFSWIFSLTIVKPTASGMLSSMPNATDLTLQQIPFWQYPPCCTQGPGQRQIAADENCSLTLAFQL